jgi:branched-subunit amino acid ABC-type transport system permease component
LAIQEARAPARLTLLVSHPFPSNRQEAGAILDILARPGFDALLLGSLYTMMALGLTLTYKITKIANFAHAEYVTIGAYVTVVAVGATRGSPLVFVAFPLSFAVSAVVALVVDEIVFKPLFRRDASSLHLLVASIGVGLVLRYIVTIYADLSDLLTAKADLSAGVIVFVAGAALTTLHVTIVPTVAAIVVALHLLFTRTRIGKGMRAMASNYDLARVSGINTGAIRRLTWILAGGLAGLAGGFWAVYNPIFTETGWRALLFIFAASILGGLTSFYGTIAGGYVVATAENFGISLLNRAFGVDVGYQPLIALAIIIAVLLIRPTGFAGLTWHDVVGWMRRVASRVVEGARRLRAARG